MSGAFAEKWVSVVLRCPRCCGALMPGAHLVRCEACGPYPVLGDVPVLVPDPAAWCARFHDAALAALAEHGLADRETVAVVQAFAEGRAEAPEVFGDDWTRHELSGTAAPRPVRGPAAKALGALQSANGRAGPAAWLAGRVREVPLAVEVGCGAGARSELLASRVAHLVVGDLSLRAVLHARRRAARHDAEVVAVVMDAEALPLRKGAVDLLVAEHLVDLLDKPAAFLSGVRRVLRRSGQALVTTPDPALGLGDDEALVELAHQAGLEVCERRDGLPWLRVNSPRFVEAYLVQALCLSPR